MTVDSLKSSVVASVAIGGIALSVGSAQGQTFETLKGSDCLTNVADLFTTGGQYLDPNNGVPNDNWSMLVRWQGSTFLDDSVSYAVGGYTSFYPPASASTWQRGVQPESSFYGTPVVQLNCQNGGMLINTWWIPHTPVVGGGYNDMFGYQWGTGHEPRPFYTFVAGQLQQTDLVVQSLIASTVYGPYTPSGPSRAYGQIALFAYLIDTTNPSLHPIAIVAQTHDSHNANNYGFISCDYPTGVWFASGDTTNSTAYMTRDPYSASSKLLTAVHNPSAPVEFYRMRISHANMTNIANGINSSPLVSCPARGYSTNPYDYVLKYGGVIAEAFITNDVTSSTLNDPSIAQVSLGLNFSGVSMYRRY